MMFKLKYLTTLYSVVVTTETETPSRFSSRADRWHVYTVYVIGVRVYVHSQKLP